MSNEETMYTESQIRRTALEKHVAAFLRCGGVVQQIPEGATGYNPTGKSTPFVINNQKTAANRQRWKEDKSRG
jgi:hypothetical protein